MTELTVDQVLYCAESAVSKVPGSRAVLYCHVRVAVLLSYVLFYCRRCSC